MPEPVELSSRIEHVDFKDKNNVGLNEKSPDLDIEAFNERVCYDTKDLTSLILAEPAIKYNAGNVMSDSFFKVSRSLFRHPSVIDSPTAYRCVLMTILDRACWKPEFFDDHGVLFELQIGQFMCTNVKLAEYANVTRNDVQRAVKRFEDVGILSQKVSRKKTIYTILWNEESKTGEPNFEPKVSQTRAEVEPQTKNRRTKDIKKQQQADVAVFYKCLEKEELTEEEKRIMTTYPEDRVILSLEYSKIEAFKESLIQQLRWHCSLPEPIKAKKPIQKEIREMFKHGEMYNGAYCWYTEDAIAFERGTKNLPVKWSDKAFRTKFEEIIKIFEIKEWK